MNEELAHDKVISLESERHAQQHRHLLSTIQYATWSMKVEAVLQALGVAVADPALDASTRPGQGSLASALGHETVGGFITEATEHLGLGMDWQEWERLVRGWDARRTFAMSAHTLAEVFAQLDPVVAHLGRQPVSAAEFHATREIIAEGERARERNALQADVQHRDQRISELARELETERSVVASQRDRIVRLEADLSSALADVDRRIAEAAREGEMRMEAKLNEQREALLIDHERELEREREQTGEQIRELERTIEALRERERSDDDVSRTEYEAIRRELAQVRERARQVRRLREALETAKSRNNELFEHARRQADRIRRNERRIQEVNSVARQRLRRQEKVIAQLRESLEVLAGERNMALALSAGLTLFVGIGIAVFMLAG